jgi:hypothetical protein
MAHFAKRHYEAIATTMQNAHPGLGLSDDNRAVTQWSETVKDLAEMFERDNSAFDIIRFVHACRPGANVRARRAA